MRAGITPARGPRADRDHVWQPQPTQGLPPVTSMPNQDQSIMDAGKPMGHGSIERLSRKPANGERNGFLYRGRREVRLQGE